jgi:ribose/xylose/arabinose/galactoside ABC-type transport system permease subunit
MNAARGLGLMITKGGAAMMPPEWGKITQTKIFEIPIMIIVAILIGIIVQVFLAQTSLGRHIFAVGDNEKTAHEKGLSQKRVKIFVYTMSGMLCGIAAILSTSQVMSAPATMGNGQDFYCIIASVLGGCSLFGGKGSIVPGVLIGALIMSVISNSLVIMGAPPNLYSIVYALVIFIVVLLDAIKTKRIKV